MQNCLKIEYQLRTSDFDRDMHLKPSALLDLFQSAAGAHATHLGVGYHELLQQGLLWVVIREKFRVVRQPAMHSKVFVSTWPLAAGRMNYQREYLLLDENGDVLAEGSSDWLIMDAVQRKLAPIKNIYPELEGGHIENRVFSERMRRIRDFEPQGEPYIICPGYSDTDMNGHVNNTKYADYVMDAVAGSARAEVSLMQMDFHKEIKQGRQLRLFTRTEGGSVYAKGVDPDGEDAFFCRLDFAGDEI